MWVLLRDMSGTPVSMENGQLSVPNDPIIHYIEGDGIGVDISPVMMSVVDAAVHKCAAHAIQAKSSMLRARES